MTLEHAKDLIRSGSPYLTSLLAFHEAFAASLKAENAEDQLHALLLETAQAGDVSSRDEAMQRLRLAKQKLALLVALYDLGTIWPLDKVTEALTCFADTAIQATLKFLWCQEYAKGSFTRGESGRGYLVLAMGKMGAFELNYSSDIDLIVFYDPDRAPLREDVEPATFFVKFTRTLVAMLQDLTADGYVFRIDLRLRPDPGATQVAIHIEAAAAYYESQGQNWERAAMIKARPCAGDMALGAEFIARMKPYIWRRYLDYAAIADVQSMKRQIHAVKGHGEIAVLGHNLKLGRGGIREIEFFAQTQQLIAGGRNPALRCIKTCAALEALAQAQWITQQTATELQQAYNFLRQLEHRAQMVNDQQTHDIPSDPAAFEAYARFSGFESGEALATQLRATLQLVQNHYAALFETAPDLSTNEGSLVFTGSDDDPATLETLRRMGYVQVTEVAASIRAWHFGRYRAMRSARTRELLTELMPALLQALARSGEADHAFFAFDKFIQSLSSAVQLLAMMKANPRILALIAQILGSAPRLAEKISAQPRILEAVTAPDFFSALPPKSVLAGEIASLIPQTTMLEEAFDLARIFAREKNFRVGTRILSETISAEEAGNGFSDVADVVIARLLCVLEADCASRHGRIAGGACIILGLGKLGGHEMTASSDLDIMLIYEHNEPGEMSDGPRPLSPGQYYARITQGLITALTALTNEGQLYTVDMRLRPSGSKGPLAVRLSAFASYQETEAWTWERMAMTRARAIAGDEKLGARVEQVLRISLSTARDSEFTCKDITAMRALMLKEHKPASLWDMKRIQGGQIDIEFIAQALELIHAKTIPELLNPNTKAVLLACGKAGLLGPAEMELLLDALALYQRLTHVLRLCITGDFNPKTAHVPLLNILARAARQPDIATTEAYLSEMQAKVAGIFVKLLGSAS